MLDNPLRYVDPTGHDAPDGGAGGSDEKEGYGDGDPEGAGGGGGGSGAGYVYIQGTRFLLEAVRAVRDTFSWLTAPTFTISYFRLQNIVTEFFRDDSDQLPGGTAGALYYENITGEIVGDAGYHLQKATEFLRALQKILNGAYADRITLSNQEYDLEGIS